MATNSDKRLRDIIPEFRKWNKAASVHWRIERKRGNFWGKKRYRWTGYATPFLVAGVAAHGIATKDPSALIAGLASVGTANLILRRMDGTTKSDKRFMMKPHIDDIRNIKTRLKEDSNFNKQLRYIVSLLETRDNYRSTKLLRYIQKRRVKYNSKNMFHTIVSLAGDKNNIINKNWDWNTDYDEVEKIPMSKIVTNQDNLDMSYMNQKIWKTAKNSSKHPIFFHDPETDLYYVGDGNHRVAAARLARKKHIDGVVRRPRWMDNEESK